jgi:hypothetical protein
MCGLGEVRDALLRQSAADWGAFLGHRAAELRPGGQLVVVGGAARDDGSSGAEALMKALDGALRDAVAAGRMSQDEYRTRTIPTWNRTLAEFEAPFSSEGAATFAGLTLLESALAALPDQYLPAYRASGDAAAFAGAVTGFVRAFTESSLIETLHRHPEDRTALADAVYCNLYDRLVSDPLLFETHWQLACSGSPARLNGRRACDAGHQPRAFGDTWGLRERVFATHSLRRDAGVSGTLLTPFLQAITRPCSTSSCSALSKPERSDTLLSVASR